MEYPRTLALIKNYSERRGKFWQASEDVSQNILAMLFSNASEHGTCPEELLGMCEEDVHHAKRLVRGVVERARYRAYGRSKMERSGERKHGTICEAAFAIASSDPSPFDEMVRQEAVAAVTAAIKELPDEERRLIWLYHFEGLTYRAIEAQTKIPFSTARAKIKAAEGNLKSALSKKLPC